jgi:uncharacterized protein (DUF2235 family)
MAAEQNPSRRRLIACCDGTWNKPDSYSGSTNVIRLARAIKPRSADGISQIVYYHSGVGTGNFVDHLIGGGTGIGLSANVRSTYAFFVDNYHDGDEIFLFGFSRGAYTARSVAGMMGHVGIVRKRDMNNFDPLWDYYRLPVKERQRHEQTFLADFRDRVPGEQVTIRCIAVWDTVGSLGIPDSRFCQTAYSFHDTALGPGVEFAYHALAMDEQRGPFQPTIWDSNAKPRVTQTVEQVWFAGVHSNIGGGYPEHELSDAALFWMCSKLDRLLDIDREQLCTQAERKRKYAKGQLVDSRTGTWKLFPRAVRKICETDPSERIHESVWRRVAKEDGQPLPSPYRNEEFLTCLEQHREQKEPLSAYELGLLDDLSSTAPEKTLPRSHRVMSLCDRIVEWLGGS